MVVVVKVRATADPEELVCLAARGDYLDGPPWRLNFGDVMKGARGGPTTKDKMKALIKLLIVKGHWGPFEHPAITFGIEGMSRVTLAQLTRHRIATFDVQSARIVNLTKLTFDQMVSPPSFSAAKVKSRKGGTKTISISSEERARIVRELFSHEMEVYKTLVGNHVPQEDARYVLSMAVPVHATMTVNARSLMHIIAIRSFGDAQWEIKSLADQMLTIAKEWMPMTFGQFETMMKTRDILGP